MSATVVMYVTPVCPYCEKAKLLLRKKGVIPQIIDVTTQPYLREEMMARSGGRMTVPQIFINDHHVGGCDDLYALEKKGNLDTLINGETL